MARTFVSASTQRLASSHVSEINGVSAFSICAWLKRTATSNMICVSQRPTSATGSFLGYFTDANCYFTVGTGVADAFGRVANNDTNWHSVVGVFDGSLSGNANRCKLYIDGVQQTLTFTGTIPATAPTNVGSMYVGFDQPAAIYANGSAAEVAVYLAALTAEEAAALADGVSPQMVRPSSIVAYLPLLGRTSPEVDLFGAYPATVTNSPAQAAHPPMRYPGRVQAWKYGAAAAPSIVGPLVHSRLVGRSPLIGGRLAA